MPVGRLANARLTFRPDRQVHSDADSKRIIFPEHAHRGPRDDDSFGGAPLSVEFSALRALTHCL